MPSPEEYSDLVEILDKVRNECDDSRLIWGRPSIGFDTTIRRVKGAVLGGSWSPRFLHKDSSRSALPWTIPWAVRLQYVRVLIFENVTLSLNNCLPLLEEIARAGESLLIVTEDIEPEMIAALLVNHQKGVLKCCAIRNKDRLSIEHSQSQILGKSWQYLPKKASELPLVHEVCVRKEATVVLPNDPYKIVDNFGDIIMIEVGGEDYDDQQRRLRFLMNKLRREDLS